MSVEREVQVTPALLERILALAGTDMIRAEVVDSLDAR